VRYGLKFFGTVFLGVAGMFVSVATRALFLAYRSNLVCPVADVVPILLAGQLATLPYAGAERRRGCVSKRHATLLRNQLKSDLLLHIGFVSHYNTLRTDDREFLKSCGIPPSRPPWRSWHSRRRGRRGPGLCVCGMCPS
jgi:hypothetical protein